jgi:hypothetical protein
MQDASIAEAFSCNCSAELVVEQRAVSSPVVAGKAVRYLNLLLEKDAGRRRLAFEP